MYTELYSNLFFNKIRRVLIICIVILLSFTFAFYLNMNKEITSGGFPGRILSFVDYNLFLQNFHPFSSNICNSFYTSNLLSIGETLKGLSILFIILSQVTGLNSQYLMLIPFGVFLTSFSYYVLIKKIFNNFEISFLLLIYILFYTITSADQLGGYAASWTFILFVLFILMNFKLMNKKSPSCVIVLFLLYLGLNIYWHTMEAKALFFIFSINALIFILWNLKCVIKEYPQSTSSIFLAMLVTTLFFKELLYKKSGYFSSVSLYNFYDSYGKWFTDIGARIGLISAKVQSNQSLFYTSSSPLNTISTFAGLALIFVISMPVLLSCAVDVRCIIGRKYLNFTKLSWLKWSLVITQVLLTVAYGLAMGAGPGIILHFFPIASIISIIELNNYILSDGNLKNKSYLKLKHSLNSDRLTQNRKVCLFLVVIVLLQSIYCFPYLLNYSKTSVLSYDDTDASSSWFVSNAKISDNTSELVLTDFHTSGKFLVLCSNKGVLFNYKTYSPFEYQKLIEGKFNNSEWTHIILNIKSIDKPVSIDQSWTPLKPVSLFITNIESSNHISKVYNDGLYITYFKKEY